MFYFGAVSFWTILFRAVPFWADSFWPVSFWPVAFCPVFLFYRFPHVLHQPPVLLPRLYADPVKGAIKARIIAAAAYEHLVFQ